MQKLGLVVHAIILALRRLRQEDHESKEASLSYSKTLSQPKLELGAWLKW
jgi:hypothetical protein